MEAGREHPSRLPCLSTSATRRSTFRRDAPGSSEDRGVAVAQRATPGADEVP